MPTNIRKYVDVIVSRATRPIDTANFSIPLFITRSNLFDADERIRSYRSVNEMTSDGWAPTSAAVRWATNVFAGTASPQTVQIGKQSFSRLEISVVPGSVAYTLTIVVAGTAPQTITFTGTELNSQQQVVDGLVALINANTNINSDVTASNVSNNLQIEPQGNAVVSISGLSSNLQSNVNMFTVDVSGGVGAQTYTLDVDGSAATFTTDATPTLVEASTGLANAANALGNANGQLYSAVTGAFRGALAGAAADQSFTIGDNDVVITPVNNGSFSDGDISVTAGDVSVRFVDTFTATYPAGSGNLVINVSGVGSRTLSAVSGAAASIASQINSDPDLNPVLIAVASGNTLSVVAEGGATIVSASASGTSVTTARGAAIATISEGSSTFSFDITVDGTTETIDTTATTFTEESVVLNALLADLNSKTNIASSFTAQVSSGELQIDPNDGVTISITNLSSNLTSGFDHYVVEPTSGAGNTRYAFNLQSSDVSNAQTIEYTSDATPTVNEILEGLSAQINQSGLFAGSLVAGVDGTVLAITPNAGEDVDVSSLTANLSLSIAGAETVEEALAAAAGEDDSFFFLCAEDKTAAVQLALGRYAQANDKMYITTVPASTVATTADDDIASQLMDAGLDNTHTLTLADNRQDEHAEGGIIGAIANFNPGETILAYKTLPGITTTDFSTAEQNRIQGKNSNIYPQVSGVNIYDNGVNQSGLFFDDVRFGLWMQARIGEAVFGLLKRESDLGRKVTYGNQGFDQIRQVIFDQVINVAIRRNAILTSRDGVPDPVVRIPDRSEIPDNDIANRTLRDVVVEFTYSGAVQEVQVRVFILL